MRRHQIIILIILLVLIIPLTAIILYKSPGGYDIFTNYFNARLTQIPMFTPTSTNKQIFLNDSTPTPAPVPTLSPYDLIVKMSKATANRTYTISMSLQPQSKMIDMTRVTFSIHGHKFNYNELMQARAYWENSDGDNWLDPTGERFIFTIPFDALGIIPYMEPELVIMLNGETLSTYKLPPMQNPINWIATPPPGNYWE